MKNIARIALQKGMVIGRDIHNYKGELIFPSGTKVDEKVTAKLARHSIIAVPIMEDIDFATTHFEKVRLSQAYRAFEVVYNNYLADFKTAMRKYAFEQTAVDHIFLLNIYRSLSAMASKGSILLDYLYNMIPNEDEVTYTHCLNSALIAGVFADWLAMPHYNKETLVLAAMFYDIGKLKLPEKLLWKTEKLSDADYVMIKTHPALGYEMMKSKNLDEHIMNSILMHHERCDGTGYPRRLTKDQIDIFARHISIIDAYEAMTSPRAYRQSLTPLQVIAKFEEEGIQRYDESLLRPILKRIADTQIGLMVKLNDDSIWEIFIINPSMLSRPILKRNGKEVLNLSEHPDLEIVSIY